MDASVLYNLRPMYVVGPLRKAVDVVLRDALFLEGIASASHHPGPHQKEGGLLLHTYEVADAAVKMSGNDEVLKGRAFVASVFHDYGKIWEYELVNGEPTKLPFRFRVGHVVYSWKFWLETALYANVNEEDQEEIGHAILAHHGRKEWGSPVEPQTRLAYILHTADMLSARGAL